MNMESKNFINESNLPEFMRIMEEVKEDGGHYNITHASKRFCLNNGFPYDDNVRRGFSRLMEKANTVLAESTDIPVKEDNQHNAKVLFFDIETSLMKALVFSPWKNYKIPLNRIIEDWIILCFSYQWMGKGPVGKEFLTEEELSTRDEARIIRALWHLLDEADIVIAHNGDRFDVPKANAKFLEYGLGLPSPFQVVDTFKLAKKNLAPTSLSLDYLSKLIGRQGKEESYGLWDRIAKGEYDALKEMVAYCDGDIVELREVFFTLRPYLKGLPNMGLFKVEDGEVCHACGSDDIIFDDKLTPYRTSVNEYPVARCACCGSLSKSRVPIKKFNKAKTTALFR